MAITGVLRPGYIQIRVLDMDAAVTHYVDRIGLNMVSQGNDGRVYLKGWDEFDRHSIILRPADTPGMDFAGFKVATERDLDVFRNRIGDAGITIEDIAAGDLPGTGRRLSFTIPSGHRLELFAEMELSPDAPSTRNPDIWPEDPRGMRASRFDHFLLYGPDIDAVTSFFTGVLDFSLAEKIDTPDGCLAVWLTCSNKAHDIAFVKHEHPGKFHHAAFLLESWHDVGHAADIIARHNIALDIGPTRHGITRGQTIYFFDPSGNRNEVFSGGVLRWLQLLPRQPDPRVDRRRDRQERLLLRKRAERSIPWCRNLSISTLERFPINRHRHWHWRSSCCISG
jgi:catechol 2,3-dioxygenase